MSQAKDKGRGKAKGKTVTKQVIKDLAPRQDVKGAATRTPDGRLAANHNETLVCDTARQRKAK